MLRMTSTNSPAMADAIQIDDSRARPTATPSTVAIAIPSSDTRRVFATPSASALANVSRDEYGTGPRASSKPDARSR